MNIDAHKLFDPFKKNNVDNFWYYSVNNKKCDYFLDFKKINVYFININFNKSLNNIEYSKLNNIEKIKLLINNCYDISSNTISAQAVIKKIIDNSEIYKIIYSDLNDLYLFINSLRKNK